MKPTINSPVWNDHIRKPDKNTGIMKSHMKSILQGELR